MVISEIIENNSNFLKKEFAKHFNEEAKKQNSKFKMDYTISKLTLQRKGWNMDNWEIRFSKNKNAFCFTEPIEEKVFEEIKTILQLIPESFVVEIIKEEKKEETK